MFSLKRLSLMAAALAACTMATSTASAVMLEPKEVSGPLAVWGWNDAGQLGNGTSGNIKRSAPAAVPGLTNITAIATGYSHALALQDGGVLWAWGSSKEGQIGNDTIRTSTNTPVQVLDNVKAVAAGWEHSLALKTDGTLWTWGRNDLGQLGDGTNANATTPVKVMSNVTIIAAGAHHTLAVVNGNTLFAWGMSWNGQAGVMGSGSNPTPTEVKMSKPGNITAIAAGTAHNLVVQDGVLYAFGANNHGQLGGPLGNIGGDRYQPTEVLLNGALFTGVTAIAAGGNTSMAVMGGNVYAWGNVNLGQFGLTGDASNYLATPTLVAKGCLSISAGEDFALAITGINGLRVQVPEPVSLSVLAIGAAGLLMRRRR